MTVEATSGGGMVGWWRPASRRSETIKINPEANDPEDAEMLEDLVLTAVNEALRKSQELQAEQMSQITGGSSSGVVLGMANYYAGPLANLIGELHKLPGVGPQVGPTTGFLPAAAPGGRG